MRRCLLPIMGLNDSAWEKLFEKYRILEAVKNQGEFIISANQIKELREPRLMTKFDHKVNLPAIFAENDLAILPITRGSYMISSFSAYHQFEALDTKVQRISIPSHIQSFSPQFLVSEAIALNCAGACGVLSDFLEDEGIVPTVSGRMGSGRFGFNIETKPGKRFVTVDHSQIEIDAAYEGAHALSLFEAKRDLADDFLIRQLYYPFRAWSQRIDKPVKTVFLVFSNGIFNLYQYQFDEINSYNSLRLVKQKNYCIETKISLTDIENCLKIAGEVPEPEISFPQADSMPRIINLMELLYEKPMANQDITAKYAFDKRQTNYYADAGRYLGLIEKGYGEDNTILFRLSAKGKHIMGLAYKERLLAIAAQILRHKVFRETLKLYLACKAMPDRRTVAQLMKSAGLYHVAADSTFFRRASTVISWTNWILDLAEKQ